MILTDTHTHLYYDSYDDDRDEMIQRALDCGVQYMYVPGVDSNSVAGMLEICRKYPTHCFPMFGLHPTDVKENYKEELATIEQLLEGVEICAVGETGLDFYWETTFEKQQKDAFHYQIEYALRHNLPLVLHIRNAFDEAFAILDEYGNESLRGVVHCFSGTTEQALQAIEKGFYIGIGGIVTFKKNSLAEVVKGIDLKHIVLETDAPFLAPTPYRGKRNESSYIPIIAHTIAEIKATSMEEVAAVTTANAFALYNTKPAEK